MRTAPLTRFDSLGAEESAERTYPSSLLESIPDDEEMATIPLTRLSGKHALSRRGMLPQRRVR